MWGGSMQVSGGDGAYTVTLSGSQPYKGFLVKTDLGTFSAFPTGTKAPDALSLLTCPGAVASQSWTHSSAQSGGSKTASLTVQESGTATLTYLVVRLSHFLSHTFRYTLPPCGLKVQRTSAATQVEAYDKYWGPFTVDTPVVAV
jgi:hypothetical protein